MDKHVFAFEALEMSNWLHTGAARVQSVARCVSIDVQRKETEGTVVTVMSTARWRPDKATTVFAFEYLVTGLSDERFFVPLTMRLPFVVTIIPIVFVVVLCIQMGIVLRCPDDVDVIRLACRVRICLIAVV